MTFTYNIVAGQIPVHAVISWDGDRGRLFCTYEERHVHVALGSQREYLREDAMRALASHRSLVEMSDQLNYCRKATCRAVANRLALLVEAGQVTEEDAREVLAEVDTKWNKLRTEHDFDRFVSTNYVARCRLDRCKRSDEDFARVVAPALAEVIKAEVKGARAAAPAAGETQGAASERVLGGLMGALKGLLQGQGRRPSDGTPEALLRGVGELVVDLRAQADASLQAGSTNAILSAALEHRGVVVPVAFGPALKARAVVDYLKAVETAAAGWQVAGKRWVRLVDRRAQAYLNWVPPAGAVIVEKDALSADPFKAWVDEQMARGEPGMGATAGAENACGELPSFALEKDHNWSGDIRVSREGSKYSFTPITKEQS